MSKPSKPRRGDPEAPVATYPPTERHPEGREARALDLVQGEIISCRYPPQLFLAHVVSVMPKFGLAEIALIRRPKSMVRRSSHAALQNVAAAAAGNSTVLIPLDELRLRSRASRPVAPYFKAAARKAAPG